MDKNSYQGYEVQKHRLMMTVKMVFQISASCLALQTLFFLLAFQVPRYSLERTKGAPGYPASWVIRSAERVPGVYREFIWKYPAAHLAQSVRFDPIFHIYAPDRLVKWPHDGRGYVSMKAHEIVRNVDYRQVLKGYQFPFFFSFLSWIFVWPAALWYVRRVTARIKDQEHIRGARLITEKSIRSESDGTGILPVASIRIPEALSRRHILIAGQTGSGKSTVLIQHLAAIQKAGRRAIANDFKGELVERFYRPDRDLILNPLDARGVGWTIFNELRSKPDLTAITGSLIPPAKGEDRFWSAAAQDVLRGVMAYCYENGMRTNVELWRAVTSPVHEVMEMCRATESGHAGYTYIQDASSKQAAGVIAVLMSYVSWLEFACDGPFSLWQWAEEEGDKMIFITSTDEVSNIMKPYLSLFADLAGKRFLALPENSEPQKNIYLILDELGNMQRLPSVKRLLTAGRSKGVVVEVGIPDFTSIESVYGREDAHTIINSCGSKLILNLGDPEAARFFSDLASEEECWESSTYYSISEHDHRGGENHNRQVRTRKVIMPAEIMRLSVGSGYFMLPGGNPAQVKIPWTDANKRPVMHKAFILHSGLSLDELEARDQEVSLIAQKVLDGPPPEELKNQVTHNAFSGVRPPLKVVEDKTRDEDPPVRPENILNPGTLEPELPEETP